MSASNGDRSRFHRLRKKKIARRARIREFKASFAASATPQAPAKKESPA